MSQFQSRSGKDYAEADMPAELQTDKSKPAHFIKVYGAGDIVVKWEDGSEETHTVADGEVLIGRFVEVVSLDGPTHIRAQWE